MEGAEPEMRAALHFHECEKPLVLNATNGELIAKITGHEDNIEKNWVGWKIVLFNDPTVKFKGNVTGGIRVRAPKQGSVQQPIKPAEPNAVAPDDTGLPF